MHFLVLALTAFTPFYVGPVSTAPNAMHWTEYADTTADGRLACLDDLAWTAGPKDCLVVPSSWAPDVTQPGWAL